ncbi:MAG: hypothetical protein AAGF85_08990 [Bacteroidota bacterium]
MKEDTDITLEKVAQSVNWFEDPRTVLSNQNKFLCYVMKYGIYEHVQEVYSHYGKAAFKKALNSVYAQILDERSMAYFYRLLDKD